MNRYFEEDILRHCKHIQGKIRVAPEMFGAAKEEPGKGQLDALRKLMEAVEFSCNDLLPRRCHTYGDIRLPWDPEKTRSGLTASLDALNRILETPKLPPLLLLFREDLEKLRDLLSAAREALDDAVARHYAQAAAWRAEHGDAIEEMQRRLLENGDLHYYLAGDEWDDTGFRRPGEDACREVVVPEEQPAPPARETFISYRRDELDPERLRRMEEERRIFQERMMREMEEVRRGNANMAPPPTAEDWYRRAADSGRGVTPYDPEQCPHCGGPLMGSTTFCLNCGRPLDRAGMPGERTVAYMPSPGNGGTGGSKNGSQKGPKRSFMDLFRSKKKDKKSSKKDEVQFRAAAPSMIHPGDYFLVKVMMHLPEDHEQADRAQKTLGDRVKAASSGIFQAQRDQLFRITLRSPDVADLCATETISWNGRFASVDMDLFLPPDFDKKQLRLHGRVYSEDAVVTDLKMILEVNALYPQEVSCEKCALRSAFISYASADRDQVVTRIQGIQLAAPDLDLFFDVENLQRGEHWEPRLYKEIEKRDLFYLFWSKNAAASPWVAKELAHAISHKGLDAIEPVPLEPPEECPPPDALKDRHFNDWTLRYRKT